ncbi:hypothetical protein H310_09763 [Aphanomyces invadans]|uniref:Uncharacterized protein n=1 Tax=Aphanomyces invadans TaxID=157072 RepID=A0A024TTH3_9STRA|nr:hypothetical protein H310_09763 [Aphanomyces invadans]ETV97435.1 hypothetical protein H310_09763 [Aphanomyces invadans]|eukprot:XP_008874143.1 hypothetical protein H310_09763 [Aphanomyces invadans]
MAKGNAIREVAIAAVLALGGGAIWKSYATSELKSFDDYYKDLKRKTDQKAAAESSRACHKTLPDIPSSFQNR